MIRWPLIEAAGFTLAMVLTALVFLGFPHLDLWVSGWFWSQSEGWYLKDWPPFRWVFLLVPILTRLIVLGLAILLACMLVYRRRIGPLDWKRVVYLLLTLAIGPGLIANTILKDHWGRARPSQIVQFGGTRLFSPALIPSDQCTSNCSFVSGHGAMAFSLIAFAFLVETARRRRWAIRGALGFGALVGVVRIAQGGHFLSDTVFAGFFMVATAWLLHRWIIDADGLSAPWVRDGAGIALAAGRDVGLWLRALARDRRRRWWLVHGTTALLILASIRWLDQPAARFFHVPDDRLTLWLRWITGFGQAWGWLVVSGLATLACRALADTAPRMRIRERWKAWALVPFYIFLCVAVSGIAADILKIVIGRTRPVLLFRDHLFAWGGPAWQASHWSFPSGHVTTAAALAAALSLLWPRHIVAYWLFALLIVLSRLGLDAHYPSDTIAGLWLGVMTALYLKDVFKRSGVPLEDAQAGLIAPAPAPWRYRLFGRPGRHIP